MTKKKILLPVIMLLSISFLPLDQQPLYSQENPLELPDIIYYSLKREKLLEIQKGEIKTVPVKWVVASATDRLPIYTNYKLNQIAYKANFLYVFKLSE